MNTFPLPPSDAVLVKREFPDFDVATLPTIPDGFTCGAWHQDVMPLWYEADSASEPRNGEMMLAIDYPGHELREYPDDPCRFHLHLAKDGSLEHLLSSDQWDDMLTAVQYVRYVRELGLGFHVDTRGHDYVQSSGEPVFTDSEADVYDIIVDDMHDVTDPYAVTFKVWNALGLISDEEAGLSIYQTGDRLRLKHDIAPYPLGTFPAGTTGTVTIVSPNAPHGNPIAYLRLDQHFEDLDHWANVLQIFRVEDEAGEVTPEAFEIISNEEG